MCDKQAANVLLNVEFAERVCVVCPGAAARRDLLATAVRSGIPEDTHQPPKCYPFIGCVLGPLPLHVSHVNLKISSWKGAAFHQLVEGGQEPAAECPGLSLSPWLVSAPGKRPPKRHRVHL